MIKALPRLDCYVIATSFSLGRILCVLVAINQTVSVFQSTLFRLIFLVQAIRQRGLPYALCTIRLALKYHLPCSAFLRGLASSLLPPLI